MSLYVSEEPWDDEDRIIAKVDGGKGKLFVSTNNPDFENAVEAVELPEGQRFELVPEYRDKIAQHTHIIGPSGCGKSSTCNELAKWFPGNRVVISADEDDDSNLQEIDGRIKADEELCEIPIENLKDSLIIFDDIEGVPKSVETSLNTFKRALHERGRKNNIKTVNVYHRGADGVNTKSSLSEMTHLVIFPQFGNNQNTKYLLTKYAGLPENLGEMLNSPEWGRRVMIGVNTVPQYMVGENCASIINHEMLKTLSKYHRKKALNNVEHTE